MIKETEELDLIRLFGPIVKEDGIFRLQWKPEIEFSSERIGQLMNFDRLEKVKEKEFDLTEKTKDRLRLLRPKNMPAIGSKIFYKVAGHGECYGEVLGCYETSSRHKITLIALPIPSTFVRMRADYPRYRIDVVRKGKNKLNGKYRPNWKGSVGFAGDFKSFYSDWNNWYEKLYQIHQTRLENPPPKYTAEYLFWLGEKVIQLGEWKDEEEYYIAKFLWKKLELNSGINPEYILKSYHRNILQKECPEAFEYLRKCGEFEIERQIKANQDSIIHAQQLKERRAKRMEMFKLSGGTLTMDEIDRKLGYK